MQIVFVQLRYSYLYAFVFLFVCSAFESHFDLSIYGLKLFTSLSALRWKVTRRRMNKTDQRIIFFWLFCCGLETLHLRLNVFSAHALNHISISLFTDDWHFSKALWWKQSTDHFLFTSVSLFSAVGLKLHICFWMFIVNMLKIT